MNMITRKEYLAAPHEEGERIHRMYHGEILEEAKVQVSLTDEQLANIKEALEAGDIHLNRVKSLPTNGSLWIYGPSWDKLALQFEFSRAIRQALKARGDYYTHATGVCLAKESARRQVEKLLRSEKDHGIQAH
jgi:hypothetical protein